MGEDFNQGRGHLPRCGGGDLRIPRLDGGDERGRVGEGQFDARISSQVPIDAEKLGASGKSHRGAFESRAKFLGVRCDAQAANRLIQLLGQFAAREVPGFLEKRFEFVRNLWKSFFENLAGAARHCY